MTAKILKSTFLLVCLLAVCGAGSASAMDTIVAHKDGEIVELVGRVTVQSVSGQRVIQTRDGQYHLIEKDDIIRQSRDDTTFVPFTQREMAALLTAEFETIGREFSTRFHIHATRNYLIVYNTSHEYAQWIGGVFETLLNSYITALRRNGFPIENSEFPLVVVLLSNRAMFEAYARRDITSGVSPGILAYYHKWTNRVVIYDQTGFESNREGAGGRLTPQGLSRILDRPGVQENLSSALHEAVHQIGFNYGVHHRFAFVPLWVCEGLALLFESPSIAAGTGRAAGVQVNRKHYHDLVRLMQRPATDPIERLIKSDDAFTSSNLQEVTDAYTLSWGLAYFLNASRPRQWVAYLKLMGAREPYVPYPPEERLADFEAHFGNNWPQFYRDMRLFYERLRVD